MNNTFLGRLFFLLHTSLLAPLVFAENSFYLNGGLGYGLVEYTKINSDYEPQYAGRTAGKLGLGFQFTPEFALETNYQYFFNANESSQFPFTDISQQLKSHAFVINLMGVVRAPITSDRFTVFVKLGPGYTSVSRQLNTNVAHLNFNTISAETTGTSLSYAAGLEYDFTSRFGISVEYLGTTLFVDNTDEGLDIDPSNREQLNSVMVNALWRY
jgi:opacity protein-like surface antigen